MVAVYLANTELLTAAGPTSYANYCAYKAGINTYQYANYHTPDHHQVVLSLVPDAALPPATDALEDAELHFRDERLVLLSAVAAGLILANYQGETMPLIMAGPQNYPGFNNQLPLDFFRHLAAQTDLPIDYRSSRTIATGRTGVLEAIRIAQRHLEAGTCEQILVGGLDSCHHTDWLHLLDRDGRLKSENAAKKGDSFVPGEGVAFLQLTSNPELAMEFNGHRIRLAAPGFSDEPGHLYSDRPYLGDGLDQSVKQALAELPPDQRVSRVFSSMNGENYWAKEFGVAMTRSSHRFEQLIHKHPADCYGDIGAAAGGGLIALAAYDCTRPPQAVNALVCTSSDTEYRAAICVIPERITA